MSHSNHVNRSTDKQSRVTSRVIAVIYPCLCAFVLNDVITVRSLVLSYVGMQDDAKIFQFMPTLLLVIWIACLQIWITTRRTFLGWCYRLVGIIFVSQVIAGSMWLYAFRNTQTIQIQSMPKHLEILKIEDTTKLRLWWHSDSDGESVTFDKRNPENKKLLKNALREHGIALLQ